MPMSYSVGYWGQRAWGQSLYSRAAQRTRRATPSQRTQQPQQSQQAIAQALNSLTAQVLNPLSLLYAARVAALERDVGRAMGSALQALQRQLAQRGIESSGIGVGALTDLLGRGVEQLVSGRQGIAAEIAQMQYQLIPQLLQAMIQREAAGLQALAALGSKAREQILQASQQAMGGLQGLSQLLALLTPATPPPTSTPILSLPMPTSTLPPSWWLGRV